MFDFFNFILKELPDDELPLMGFWLVPFEIPAEVGIGIGLVVDVGFTSMTVGIPVVEIGDAVLVLEVLELG